MASRPAKKRDLRLLAHSETNKINPVSDGAELFDRQARQGGRFDPYGRIRRRESACLTRLFHDLRLVFIQVETSIKLRLLGKKILETGFVLEWTAQLGAVIGDRPAELPSRPRRCGGRTDRGRRRPRRS